LLARLRRFKLVLSSKTTRNQPAWVMLRRICVFSIACGAAIAGLSALTAATVYAPARAQSADQVLCDRVAADPADPDKPKDIKGVPAIAPSDVAIAIKYCRIASARSRRALYALGRAYAANRQLPQAIAAYRKAADKGSTAAMIEFGVLYANGAGVAKDPAAARTLFERAAKAGNPRGMTNLATLAGRGGTPLDPAKQRALLEQAAQENSAEAEFQLGLMYANGVGGAKDDVAARAMFEKAAAQGHAGALEWMGAFAEIGRGGPRDKTAAKVYYEKAAALGDQDAKARLKEMECPYVIKDKRGNVLTHLCF
jgi:TPR repeat protein